MTADPPTAVHAWADTVLYGGRILTVDEDFTVADAVAIRDGRIQLVGSDEAALACAGADTATYDLEGRTVIPGLIDSHVHLKQVGVNRERITLFEARTIDDVLEAISTAAGDTPAGEWLMVASGWHESQLAEARLPTATELDRTAPDNPVFVPRGGHVAVLNSAGLRRAGIDADTPDPEGGTIVRDPETGEPTGVVLEEARSQLVDPVLPDRDYADRLAAIERGMTELNSRGVTAALEPGLYRDDLRAYQQIATEGRATVRTDALVRIHTLEDVEELAAHYHPGFGNAFLKIGGVKYMLDGGVEGAYLEDAYETVEGVQEQDDYHGHLILPPGGEEELREMFALAADRGHQVQTHVVGDAAIEKLLDAYEAAAAEHSIEELRWAAMHVFLPTAEQIDRMRDLGLVVTAQNHPTYLGLNMRKWWGDDRASRAIPVKTLLEAGLTVGGGTDAPVVPWFPFDSLWWLTTRDTVTAGTLGPEEAIDRETALRLWTEHSAYTMGWEDELGTIEAGKRADMAVLSDAYLDCSADAIREIDVTMTMVGGEPVYATAEWPHHSPA
ncbi:MAG: amidohydrolase [Halobacteriales archaeon]|nr:amidohydrolase [Halobacteriales archaeon]